MSRPHWDNQFRETVAERNQRLRSKRTAVAGSQSSLQAKFVARLKTLILDFEQAGLSASEVSDALASVASDGASIEG